MTKRNTVRRRPKRPRRSELLKAALNYAGHGYRVFPVYAATKDGCSCGDSDCTSPGKHPRVSWKDGGTKDGSQIKKWWSQYRHSWEESVFWYACE